MNARSLNLFSVLLVVMLGCSIGAQDLLVTGGRVIPMAGDPLPVGNVLIEGGKVVAVGKDVTKEGVTVLDATGKVVMPGFVLAHTQGGLDAPNEMMDVTPYVSVLDSIDPSQPFFEDSLRDGHLTLAVMPGNRAAIAGTGRILRPWGLTVESMTQETSLGIKMSMVPKSGNRGAWLARIRASLDSARDHLKKKAQADDPKPGERTGNVALDLEAMGVEKRQLAMVRLLKKDIPAWVHCGTAGDVVNALKLAKEYGFDVRLILDSGTWRAAQYVAEAKVPVVLSPNPIRRETDPDTGKEVERNLAKILHDAGVAFAFTSDTSNYGRRYLWYQAACLVRWGLPVDAALAAVTRVPAEVLGFGARKGSLEAGKDGDLLVLTADPLSGRGWVDQAVIGGKVVYERKSDPRLAEVFGAPK